MNKRIFYLLISLLIFSPAAFSQRGKPKKDPPAGDTIPTIKIKKKEEEKLIPKLDTTSKRNDGFIQMSGKGGMVPGQSLCELNYGYQFVSTSNLAKGIFNGQNNFSNDHIIYGADYGLDFNDNGGLASFSLFNFTRINPEKISVDAISSWTLSGFRCHVINMGFNLLQMSRHIELLTYAGFEYGRLDLTHESQGVREYKYKNPFFTFNLMVDLRYNIFFGRSFLNFGLRGGLFYDPGNPRWVSVSGGGPSLPGTKMKGYYYSFLISLPLN